MVTSVGDKQSLNLSQVSTTPSPQPIGAVALDNGTTASCLADDVVDDAAKLCRKSQKERERNRDRTLWLLCMVAAIEGADQQLLPATFRALEIDLGFSPVLLGEMSLAQSLFQSLAAPFWGFLADRYPRRHLLTISCCAWGFLTLLLAMATSAEMMLVLRCFHGGALASLSPIAQSVVADVTHQSERGVAFGWVASSICLGQVVAAFVGTTLAQFAFFSVVSGWRVAFLIVAVASLIAAVLVRSLMDDVGAAPSIASHYSKSRCRDVCCGELRRALGLLQIPTFLAIALQGVFGTIPWSAMSFMTMYLQYCGYDDTVAATIASTMLIGKGLGSIVGGFAGDALALWSPAHGRPCLAQVSVLAGIPLIASIVYLGSSAVGAQVLAFLSFVLGLVASWCGAGVNRPILTEVVDPAGRASIVAWIAAIEGSSGALFGAPVVGALAEGVFGYQRPATNSTGPLDPDIQINNVVALSNSMLWGTIPGWLVCASIYTILHFTYAADVQRARQIYKMSPIGSEEEHTDDEVVAQEKVDGVELQPTLAAKRQE